MLSSRADQDCFLLHHFLHGKYVELKGIEVNFHFVRRAYPLILQLTGLANREATSDGHWDQKVCLMEAAY